MASLNKIFIYPFKALAGVELTSVNITAGGTLKGDRRWALFDKNGRVQNGKNNKNVFSLSPTFNLNEGWVSFVGETQRFELSANVLLEGYLSEQLHKTIRIKENISQGFPDDPDAYGPTLVSTSSLEMVASWYPGLTLDNIRARFRVNLEVKNTPAFWEDQVFQADNFHLLVRVGGVAIQPTNPCARCSVPMKEPNSGERFEKFYEIFLKRREQTKPTWLNEACFDHWYRLSINTRVDFAEQGKVLNLNDDVTIL